METTSTGSGSLTLWRRWSHSVGLGVLIAIALLVYAATLSSGIISRFLHYYDETKHVRFSVYYTAEEYGFGVIRKDQTYFDSLIRVPERFLRDVEIPTLVLDIKFKHMQKLREKRSAALARGLLIQGDDDFVPAAIRYGDRTVEVKLRLKGDEPRHLLGDKWSLRIHTKGDGHVFGLRRFSLQHPRVRAYQSEILFFEMLQAFDVLAPRYFNVRVILNGQDIGIMAVEEHFAKELLESNGRREGIIVRFDESIAMETQLAAPYDSYKSATVDAFQSSKIARSAHLQRDYDVAVGLIRGFKNGDLLASDVFEIEKMAWLMVISQMYGASHALNWRNIRFYLNPMTVKLEPIAYDGQLQYRLPAGASVILVNSLFVDALKDPQLLKSYRMAWQSLVTAMGDVNLIKRLQDVEKDQLEILHKEFVLLDPFDFNELRSRLNDAPDPQVFNKTDQTILQSGENTYNGQDEIARYPQLVHAYLIEKTPGSTYLELNNVFPHKDVVVQEIRWVGADKQKYPFVPENTLAYPFTLLSRGKQVSTKVKQISYNVQPIDVPSTLEVIANIQGKNHRVVHTAAPYAIPLKEHPLPTSDPAAQMERHGFLKLSEDRIFSVHPGTWQVHRSIVIPEGYSLHIPAGTTLQFAPDAAFIMYGPLKITGKTDAPVELTGIPGEQQGDNSWPGVVALNVSERSEWSHVAIRNTSGISYPMWHLTGGVTFYYSDVDMDHCSFTGHSGEDALNIIHSEFSIRDTQIINTASDGFDSDFSTGIFTGGLFQDIGQAGGGDAFDMSGSEVTIEDTRFLRINDKALSVGERSRLTALRITAEDVGTGAASKDQSVLEINDSTISRARIAGLLAYIKKTEYGPAQLTATGTDIVDSYIPAKVQTGSTLILNGKQIGTEDMDVDILYDTVMKRGVR